MTLNRAAPRFLAWALSALMALPSIAGAQTNSTLPPIAYPNATGNFSSPGVVASFLNGSNQAVPASAANPMPVTLSGGGSITANQGTAAAASGAWPVYGTFAATGTTGTDFSANKPTLPNIGANFAASGPYASYFLVATAAASATRNNIDIENISGAQIAIVRDDGTASGGAAPANASVFALGGGASAGAQGGSWSSTTFKGRIQVYAPASSAIVTVMVD